MVLPMGADHPSGKAPLGYDFNEQRLLVREEETAKLVEYAFILVGTFGFPLRKTLRIVTRAGLRTKTGQELHLSSLHSVLTNPFYTGTIRFGEEHFQGTHRAVVSAELFDNVQRNLHHVRK